MITVITSGYFNPVHRGHVQLMTEAAKLGNRLLVIVNNDEQVKLKGSVPFMDEMERLEIVCSLKPVTVAVLSCDTDRTVIKTLERLRMSYPNDKLIFAKGGDTKVPSDIPETDTCKRLGIELIFGVGGDKVQSSSDLIKNVRAKLDVNVKIIHAKNR